MQSLPHFPQSWVVDPLERIVLRSFKLQLQTHKYNCQQEAERPDGTHFFSPYEPSQSNDVTIAVRWLIGVTAIKRSSSAARLILSSKNIPLHVVSHIGFGA